jgi:hypothetical protein
MFAARTALQRLRRSALIRCSPNEVAGQRVPQAGQPTPLSEGSLAGERKMALQSLTAVLAVACADVAGGPEPADAGAGSR